MGRVRRVDVGGMVYHGWNRANFRSRLFKTEAHYQDFLALLEEGLNCVSMRILAYCLMPNHWHLVLYPRADGDLSGGRTVSGTLFEERCQVPFSVARSRMEKLRPNPCTQIGRVNQQGAGCQEEQNLPLRGGVFSLDIPFHRTVPVSLSGAGKR